MPKDNSILPAMNVDIVKGEWKEIKGKLMQRWAKLTNDVVLKMEGSYEELEGILQKKYGYAKEDASREIHAFLNKEGFSNAKNGLASAKQDLKNTKDHLSGK